MVQIAVGAATGKPMTESAGIENTYSPEKNHYCPVEGSIMHKQSFTEGGGYKCGRALREINSCHCVSTVTEFVCVSVCVCVCLCSTSTQLFKQCRSQYWATDIFVGRNK